MVFQSVPYTIRFLQIMNPLYPFVVVKILSVIRFFSKFFLKIPAVIRKFRTGSDRIPDQSVQRQLYLLPTLSIDVRLVQQIELVTIPKKMINLIAIDNLNILTIRATLSGARISTSPNSLLLMNTVLYIWQTMTLSPKIFDVFVFSVQSKRLLHINFPDYIILESIILLIAKSRNCN